MSIVTIKINGKDLKLSCPEENKDRLLILADTLDSAIKEMATINKNASFELLLVMFALGLIDEKQTEIKISGGEALEKVNQDFQKQLSSIYTQLQDLSGKVSSESD